MLNRVFIALNANALQLNRSIASALMLALFLASTTASVSAQDSLDFIDPLEDLRSQVTEREAERVKAWQATAPRQTPKPQPAIRKPVEMPAEPAVADRGWQSSGFSSGIENAKSFARETATRASTTAAAGASAAKADLGGVASGLGIPTNRILLVVGILIASLAALVGWALFQRHPKRVDYGRRRQAGEEFTSIHEEEIQRRRVVDSSEREEMDAHDFDDEFDRPVVHKEVARREAARSEVADHDAELPRAASKLAIANSDDRWDAGADDEEVFGGSFGKRAKEKSEAQPELSRDTDTWKKPNLDRLRSSIATDWKASKLAPKSGKAAQSASRPAAPEDQPMTELVSDWDSWDAGLDDQGDVWGASDASAAPIAPLTSPAAAAIANSSQDRSKEPLNRIRALRNSLKAS